MTEIPFLIVVYAESGKELQEAARLAESIRTFGGRVAEVPIRLYTSFGLLHHIRPLADVLDRLQTEICHAPAAQENLWLYMAGKVAAAADAERTSEPHTILIVLDSDTVVLQEPSAFQLPWDVDFAYVPIMHNRSGSLYDALPNPFWQRTFDILSISDSQLFPMFSAADQQKIRTSFHAGLLVCRKERGLLQRWLESFELLGRDPQIKEFCRNEELNRIFLHQMALVGLLQVVSLEQIAQLPDTYNYPIFFDKQYGAVTPYNDISSVVTMRDVVSPACLRAEWPTLKGPSDKLAWLHPRLIPD